MTPKVGRPAEITPRTTYRNKAGANIRQQPETVNGNPYARATSALTPVPAPIERPRKRLTLSLGADVAHKRVSAMTKEEAKAKRRAKAQNLREGLVEAFQLLNIKKPKPVIVGAGDELRRWAKAKGYSSAVINLALNNIFRGNGYLRALSAEKAMRHALDGSPVEPVSDEDRQRAQVELAKRLLNRKQKFGGRRPKGHCPRPRGGRGRLR